MSFPWPVREGSTSRLLVSVRNVAEAAAALRGGCDIIDIKEPQRGSLGMAAPVEIREIVTDVRRQSPRTLVTAALGEVVDYLESGKTAGVNWDLPPLDLVKIGCARLAETPDWRQQLRSVRNNLSQQLQTEIGWVGVSYVDWQIAQAPHPFDIVAEGIEAGCRGILFDTFSKSGKRLLDWISVTDLQQMASELHSQGIFMAVAGSLTSDNLVLLAPVGADVIAIRGAACKLGTRTEAIDEEAVRGFRRAMDIRDGG